MTTDDQLVPRPPEGVRLEYADGSVSDVLAVLYVGIDEDGMYAWEACAPGDQRPARVLVAVIPPLTTLRIVPA